MLYMKDFFKVFVCMGIILHISKVAAFEVDGMNFTINAQNRTASVSYLKTYSGDIIIPEKIEYNTQQLDVVGIGEGAFKNCTSISSVFIPKTITYIGRGAFTGCLGMESINIPGSVKTVGAYAFSNCQNLAEVNIEDGVQEISDDVFAACKSLKTLVFPNSIQTLGSSVFYKCSSLDSVVISDRITQIEPLTFWFCSNLRSVVIGSSVTSVSANAFEECYNIKEIVIKDGYSPIEMPFSFHYYRLYMGRNIISTSLIYQQSAAVLTIGPSVTQIENSFSANLIYSHISSPRLCKVEFSNDTYASSILYVPTGTRDLYLETDKWKLFFNIQEMDFPSGICNTQMSKPGNNYYGIDGQEYDGFKKGLNIINDAKGRTRKVFIK